jgi:hypothetical protein
VGTTEEQEDSRRMPEFRLSCLLQGCAMLHCTLLLTGRDTFASGVEAPLVRPTLLIMSHTWLPA